MTYLILLTCLIPFFRYVLLYGYPSSEDSVYDNDYYPRPLDELHAIQSCLGPVRQIMTTLAQAEDFEISDELVPRAQPDEEPKEVKPTEEGEEAAAEEPAAEEGEEGGPKFDPTQFDWTNSDGKPKLLTQVYHKIGCERVSERRA